MIHDARFPMGLSAQPLKGKEKANAKPSPAKPKFESPEVKDKKASLQRRDGVYERQGAPLSKAESEGLKAQQSNPELKNRQQRDPRLHDPRVTEIRKTEANRRDDRLDAQAVPNSVFGRDRVTLSPEAQVVPNITRKAEAANVKKQRQKFLPPGINGLAARANPSTPPTSQRSATSENSEHFDNFLAAFQDNFG